MSAPICQYSLNSDVHRKSRHPTHPPLPQAPPRRARGARRAERITEAAVKLHGTLGPARTTVSGVAEEAGVQRATVYRHFPDEEALFAACSAHYWAAQPAARPAAWARSTTRTRVCAWRSPSSTPGTADRADARPTSCRDAPLVPAMPTPRRRVPGYLDGRLRGRPAGAAGPSGGGARGASPARSATRSIHDLAVAGARAGPRSEEAVAMMLSLVRHA